MKPLIVNCHTGEDLYVEGVERMRKSAEELGYEVYTEEVSSKGSWTANCAFKPKFLTSCVARFGRPLVWVDADAVLYKPLEHLECPYIEFAVAWDPLLPFKSFASGVVYLAATPASHRILEEWGDACNKAVRGKSREWDQVTLYKVWKKMKDPPVTKILPQGYVKIFDHPWRGDELQVEYVRHYQFSRQIKRKAKAS